MTASRPTQALVRISLLREDGHEIDAAGYKALERRVGLKWRQKDDAFSVVSDLDSPHADTTFPDMGFGFDYSREDMAAASDWWEKCVNTSFWGRFIHAFRRQPPGPDHSQKNDEFSKVRVELLDGELSGMSRTVSVCKTLTNGAGITMQWSSKMQFEVAK